MTLKEFLQVCCKDDYVGIWDVSVSPLKKRLSHKRFEICPKQQNYFKIANIPYGRIMYYLDKDVMCINHTEKGILVRLYDKEKTSKNLYIHELSYAIAKMIRVE